MRISAKGRYALAAMTSMAQVYSAGENVTLISIAERLGISKIYLEQVFSRLKKAGLVISVKGSQGGYQLARMPKEITALDVLIEVEAYLFEKAEDSVKGSAPDIEAAMRKLVLDKLDEAVGLTLSGVTLSDLVEEAQKLRGKDALMFYI